MNESYRKNKYLISTFQFLHLISLAWAAVCDVLLRDNLFVHFEDGSLPKEPLIGLIKSSMTNS